jgi:A/G-specific adenine glycosylase
MDSRHALLRWFGPRARRYPWRRTRDPYRVLVSEVMLQQTQASRVAPAYRAFVRRFPTVRALARAPLREVLAVWSGLGYNRRALALREAARRVVADHRGRVPSDPEVLRSLPGVGPYTAAAVASIAYGVPVPAVDTNAARVVARARLGVEPGEAGARGIGAAAERWVARSDPGAWNQAVMDLGREVCRPVPRCGECPLARMCRFRRAGRGSRSGARPAPARRAPRFAGSVREARGAVLRTVLRAGGPVPASRVARLAGVPLARVLEAAAGLARDGLVRVEATSRAGSGTLLSTPPG